MEKEPKDLSNEELLQEFASAINDRHDAFKGYVFYTDGGTKVLERAATLKRELLTRLTSHISNG